MIKQEDINVGVGKAKITDVRKQKSMRQVYEREIVEYETKIMEKFISGKLTAIELGKMLTILKKINESLSAELVHEEKKAHYDG